MGSEKSCANRIDSNGIKLSHEQIFLEEKKNTKQYLYVLLLQASIYLYYKSKIMARGH